MPHRPPFTELRRARPLLGTLVEITASGVSEESLARAVARAFAAIEQVQALLSFYDQASDLARLNRAAPGEWVRVQPLSAVVLRNARALTRASGGRFDAAIAPRLQSWGLLPRMPPKKDVRAASPTVARGHRRSSARGGSARGISTRGCAALEFAAGSRVRLTSALTLDLGGIAKGYAVDRAVAVLRRAGVKHGVVNAGGDLRVFGDEAAVVQVRHPGKPGVFFSLGAVRAGALATSALTYSTRHWRGRAVGALVDPRSGQACGHGVSITVVAGTAWLADGLTKVVASALGELGFDSSAFKKTSTTTTTGNEGQATKMGAVLRRYKARAVIIDAAGHATWLGAVTDNFSTPAHVA